MQLCILSTSGAMLEIVPVRMCMTHRYFFFFGKFSDIHGQTQDPLTAPLAPLEGLQIKGTWEEIAGWQQQCFLSPRLRLLNHQRAPALFLLPWPHSTLLCHQDALVHCSTAQRHMQAFTPTHLRT